MKLFRCCDWPGVWLAAHPVHPSVVGAAPSVRVIGPGCRGGTVLALGVARDVLGHHTAWEGGGYFCEILDTYGAFIGVRDFRLTFAFRAPKEGNGGVGVAMALLIAIEKLSQTLCSHNFYRMRTDDSLTNVQKGMSACSNASEP